MIAMQVMRPRVIKVYAKKSDSEAPGDGRRRVPNRKENSSQGIEPSKKEINPIKKFMMDFFKIEEIDYEKFRKEDKWAIHPTKKK